MREQNCHHLGKIRGLGLGRQPDVYNCTSQKVISKVCTLTNPTNAKFNGQILQSCDTCPFFLPKTDSIGAKIPCGVSVPPKVDIPPLLIRGLNFALAMARWARGGFQVRSQDEIDERLAICQSCPHLVDNHCKLCGCACVEKNRLINKLALKTEKCPIGKWS